MNISRKLIYLCATVLTAILSVGCSQSDNGDDPDDPGFETGIPTEVNITICARSGNQTRAGDDADLNDPGKDKDPNATVELIHSWWIAFVDANKNVTILKQNEVADRKQSISSSVTDPNGGFESETFKLTLPSGNYDIYAFANIIAPSDPKKFVEDALKENGGVTGKTLSALVSTIFTDDGMKWPSSEKIPMTGVMNKFIRNTVEEAFSIEVVRAVAKVEFDFENPSDEDITLHSLKFGRLTKSDVFLFPRYEAIDGKEPFLAYGTPSYGVLSFTFKDDDNNDIVLSKGSGNHNMYFYCKESLASERDETIKYNEGTEDEFEVNYKKNSFSIMLGVTKGDEKQTKTFHTKNILRYINRNDWIHIPIKFNDWIVEWRLHFYPPIGGYPPVLSQDGSGENITATVSTGGEFELYPSKIMKNNESIDYSSSVDWSIQDIDDTSEEPTQVPNKAIQVNVISGGEMFVQGKEPKVIDNPSASVATHPLREFPKLIVGEIDPKKVGKTAEVEIKFYLKEGPYVSTPFKCTFSINYPKAEAGS